MERAALLAELAEARRHVERGDVLVETQRRIIASLSATAGDTTAAQKTLDAMLQTQDLRLAHVEVLLDALDKVPLAKDDDQT